MAFKRKRTYAPKRNMAKRRRFAKRRGLRKTSQISSLSTGGRRLGFRSRKLSRRVYNRKLWDATLFKTHYRSAGGSTSTVSAGASTTQQQINIIPAMDNGTARFYETGGGVQQADEGVSAPSFRNDIVLRGGQIELRITNANFDDTTYTPIPIKCNLWLVRMIAEPVLTLPSTGTMGWSPDLQPEFKTKFGTAIRSWQFLLKPGDSQAVSWRVGIQKIDHDTWQAQAYGNLKWVLSTIPLDIDRVDSGDAAQIVWARTFNVSFSGDATT